VTSQLKLVQAGEAAQKVAEFFRKSAGEWRSQRRYYTLPDGETKEMVSYITIKFLEPGCAELKKLAQLHQLRNPDVLTCGAEVSWESRDSVSQQKQSKGATMFGVAGSTLYRDRGFATTKPVTAEYYFLEPETMCLRTEYNGSVFEEQLKLIGDKYRTRQTIISRAGEQQMIGQYLEKRVESSL
jgi:CpeS-like protein